MIGERIAGPSSKASSATADAAAQWDERVTRALNRMPDRLRRRVDWLRVPARRRMRAVAGTLLILGGLLSILPVFGLWMLPLGLALLAEDSPAMKRRLEHAVRWGERLWRRLRRTGAPSPHGS